LEELSPIGGGAGVGRWQWGQEVAVGAGGGSGGRRWQWRQEEKAVEARRGGSRASKQLVYIIS